MTTTKVECDTCHGKGTWEVYYDDSEIVRGEATCEDCNGTGEVDETPEIIANGIDTMLSKLLKRKSRIEVCDIINITDNQGREMKVYYRVIDAPNSPQTDESSDNYSIEQVTYKERKVNLSGRAEQSLLEQINVINP